MKCKYRFRSKRRKKKKENYTNWYYKYAVNQRTLEDISSGIGITKKYLQQKFDSIFPYTGEVFPVQNKDIIVGMDASNISNVEVLTLLRGIKKENFYWKWSKTEKVKYYRECLESLENLGYKFSGFVIDGRRGVRQMLENKYPSSPIQYCQFHQIQIIKRYLPRKVKSDAGKMLRAIVLRITSSNSIQFSIAIKIWNILYEDFLKERSFSTNPFSKRKWWYTHKNLRSAYRSVKNNLPYLFTFEEYPDLNIPNTTNICDGYFSHLKERLNRHRGLNKNRKKKMANFLLSLNLPGPKKKTAEIF